ncbi:rRNA maturation RNase YbeY [Deferribacterales bacterium Es71-Z0220]|jgi:probable rRNA maturation factor|uniref:rRNA maturation RNase YbeY n=1 Tax=Deferrivibrio essentukiensis TaxID=2880922 RepID=UPI001F6093F4|nr:rRNA maturation RNase YbeY [Deferrivibrio essentukiensis]MBZ4672778.1 ybeY [Deferribacteraceae bacterium]MCB4204275.1 rRNA maturation RNase YbeY [Deferrivibrio essentukiensis]
MGIKIYLTDEVESGFSESFIKEISERVLEKLQINKNLKVSVLITNDSEIQTINNEYRNIDKPTDVLSFPQFEKTEDILDDSLLGDIVISIDTLKKQANENEIDVKREAAFLIIHGFLHLLGYDHMDEKQEEVMFDLQENILKSLVDDGVIP